ncbi:MAG: hypothetical protein ACFWUJ_04005 [Pseudomonas fragi]
MGFRAVFLMGVCVAPIGENSGPRRVVGRVESSYGV